MSREIVEGCLAITFGNEISSNNGVTVVVGKFVGKYGIFPQKDFWDTDHVFPDTFGMYKDSTTMSGSRLMRIDGYEETQSEKQNSKELA